jgi:hypothetical protein
MAVLCQQLPDGMAVVAPTKELRDVTEYSSSRKK